MSSEYFLVQTKMFVAFSNNFPLSFFLSLSVSSLFCNSIWFLLFLFDHEKFHVDTNITNQTKERKVETEFLYKKFLKRKFEKKTNQSNEYLVSLNPLVLDSLSTCLPWSLYSGWEREWKKETEWGEGGESSSRSFLVLHRHIINNNCC